MPLFRVFCLVQSMLHAYQRIGQTTNPCQVYTGKGHLSLRQSK